jgi:co-chaperonin GroES (HSP10)
VKTKKNNIIVGDLVLIDHDEGSGKIAASLHLPPTVKEKMQVGCVVRTVPGYAVLLNGSATEGGFEEKKYLIMPHAAIPALVRTKLAVEGKAA